VGEIYFPIVTQEFVNWDDPKHIKVVWKPSWERAWRIVTDFDLQYSKVTYYSPLHFLSLMADQTLIGSESAPTAWIAKAVNALHHLVNTVLVFALLSAVGLGRRAAFMGALLFGVHPVQVGTVAWIAERKNLLATFFYLSALIVFIKKLPTDSRYCVVVAGLFLAGLLSKPSLVTLPVVAAAWVVMIPDYRLRRSDVYVLLGVMLLISVFWGLYVASTEVSQPGTLPPVQYRPLLAAGAVFFYLGKFLVPYKLVPLYPRWDVASEAWFFASLFALLSVGLIALVHYRNRIDRLVLWGILFFLVNIAPVSGLIAFGHMAHSFVADHLVYLPVVGLALAVARGTEILFERLEVRGRYGSVALVAAYAIICVWGALAIKQTMVWRNPSALWEETLKVTRVSPTVYCNYAAALMSKGELEKALDLFQVAAELAPGLDLAYLNMGKVYDLMGRKSEAQAMYQNVLISNPENIQALALVATGLREAGKESTAIELLEYAVTLHPSAVVRHELGRCYHAAGRNEDALREFDQAMRLDPLLPDSYTSKAILLLGQGATDQAIALLNRAIDLEPNPIALNALGMAYTKRGQLEQALEEFLKGFEIRPDIAETKDNVVNTLIALGELEAAKRFCSRCEDGGFPCGKAGLKEIQARSVPASSE
jgi:tetratricopeptide (TPR) repeat protein